MPDDVFPVSEPDSTDQQRRLLLQERIRKGLHNLGLPDIPFWIPADDTSVHGAALITRDSAERLARGLEEIDQTLVDLTRALGAVTRVDPNQLKLDLS